MEKELINVLERRLEDSLFQMFGEINEKAMVELIQIRKEDPLIRKIINESMSYVIFEMNLERALVNTIMQLEDDKCLS